MNVRRGLELLLVHALLLGEVVLGVGGMRLLLTRVLDERDVIERRTR